MHQKISILFVVKSYSPAIGGVEKHVEHLSKILYAAGNSVTIITEQSEKKLKLSEKKDGVVIYRIPVSKSTFLKKFFIWKWVFCNLSVFVRADIIHFHDVFYYIIPFRPLLFYKKMYVTFHGYEGYPIKIRWIILRKVSELLSNGSICVGDFMKKWYFARPSTVTYGAVRLKGNTTISNRFSAVFFGRLDEQTGILEYIEAYRKIKEKYPKFRLTIIGEGKFRNRIPKDVKVVPFVKDVSGYIQKNKFIFVSRYLSMLEALALKREVIAVYDNPVKRDYLLMSPFKKYVFVAKSGNEVADFVTDILNNRSLAHRNEGYAWAKKQSWEKLISTYLRLWSLK